MLKPQINLSYSLHNLLPLHKPFISGDTTNNSSSSPSILREHISTKKPNATRARTISTSGNIKAIAVPFVPVHTKVTTIKGVINIKPTISSALTPSPTIVDGVPEGRSILLELVSNDLDSKGNRKTVTTNATYDGFSIFEGVYKYKCSFAVPQDFGKIGAILVENEDKKMFFKTITLDNNVTFTCESWVQCKYEVPGKRIFFTSKCYLPSKTPEALKSLRREDLESLRGNGEGERQSYDRIYDYDVYNDLADPENGLSLARPVLGGEEYPYPRRCRTGRPMSNKDPMTETRSSSSFYVPCDEDFSEIKEANFLGRLFYYAMHALVPIFDSIHTDKEKGFPSFTEINKLYNEGVNIPRLDEDFASSLPSVINDINIADAIIKFDIPETMHRDSFSWSRDEEFCRQMLAGINPCSIQLVTEWPLMSKLDPEIYGPPESAITKEIVEQEIGGIMTFNEALAQKKLFMLDYHDLLLPYVDRSPDHKGAIVYGSRTFMFLTPNGTLRPLAIELTRPQSDGKPQWKHVYTPSSDATDAWLWKLAKAHVLSHDSGYHQLISHWLRTHCATEPYIIATNRHLSQMHPIQQLLHPHFRYNMQINALARKSLISAGGIIEQTFAPAKYCMQLSSDAYDQLWRFDHEALPADLISRGMAVEDPSAPHGLKLTIEDYPYANDGLLVYDAIKQWVTSYVNHYYPQPDVVESDEELQAWWNEIRTVGHGDKKDEPWWPQLKTQDDLIGIISTIIWVAAGQHSAVNFGQYDFAGYFPNRPSIARTKMPNEDPTDEEWQSFIERPEDALLKCFPSQFQAALVTAILGVLSSHSTDEEYIGVTIEPAWKAETAIKAAFQVFKGRLNELEGIIDLRNNDPLLRNRSGAGLVPYTLLKPYSGYSFVGSGVTGKGVPNSISI